MKTYNLLIAFTLCLCGCQAHDEHAESAEEGHEHAEGEILLEPEEAERLGVTTETVSPQPFSPGLKAAGRIATGAGGTATATAPSAGEITLMPGITVGSKVAAGQTIATIKTSGMAGGDVNKAAKANLDAAKRELDRLKPLLDDGLATRGEYNEALRAYEEASALYSQRAASGKVTAPAAGTVTEILANTGSYVEVGSSVAAVGRGGKMTLEALVPAKYAGRRFTDAVITLPDGSSHAISEYGGTPLAPSAAMGESTPGYQPVYFTFNAAGLPLNAGAPVEVYLISDKGADSLTVPKEALSEQQGVFFVYVKTGEHSYRKQPVKTGASDGKRVALIEGVASGDEIVATGTTFVRLAETGKAIPEGHSHNH